MVDIICPDAVQGVAVGVPVASPAIFLRGIGGIGKSTVALKILAHQKVLAGFGGRRFFVRCEKVDSAKALQGHLLRELAVVPSQGQTAKDALVLFFCIAPVVMS